MLPLLPVKSGWSRVRLVDFPRVAMELATGHVATKYGRLVLEIPYGGIGDHLFYTVAAWQPLMSKRIEEVVISRRSKDNYGGRLFDLIWKTNPYIGSHYAEKFTDDRGWRHSGARPVAGNFCDGIVAQLTGRVSAPGTNRPILCRSTARPKHYEDQRYIVIDFNRRSNRDRLEHRWEEINYHANNVIRERFPDHALVNYASVMRPYGLPQEDDIGDYFSMIEHCDGFFGCYSGGAVLAAAYNKPAWVYCHHRDPSQSFVGHTYVELG